MGEYELFTLAVAQVLLGIDSEARWLRVVPAALPGAFPYLPGQSGYNKRLRAALPQLKRVIRMLAADTDLFAAVAIGRNARANGVRVAHTVLDLLDADPPEADLLLAGDICYERPLAVRALAWLRSTGLADALLRSVAAADGPYLLGLCGGLQLLGRTIRDPQGIEETCASAEGLGLLEIDTQFELRKTLHRVEAEVIAAGSLCHGCPVVGYEVHQGTSRRRQGVLPWLRRPSLKPRTVTLNRPRRRPRPLRVTQRPRLACRRTARPSRSSSRTSTTGRRGSGEARLPPTTTHPTASGQSRASTSFRRAAATRAC